MSKIKLLLGLVAMLMTFVVVASPAAAEFQTKNPKGQGKIKSFPESSVFHSSPGTEKPGVECKAKNKAGEVVAEGEWEIQAKTQNKAGFQPRQLKGPHLQLKITKWGHCVGPTELPAEVKCSLQIEQVTTTTFTGSVYPPGCEVKFGTCTVTVAAGSANSGLKEIKLENKGTEEIGIKSNVSGITSTVAGAECTTAKVEGGTNGEFKTEGGELVLAGLTTS